LKTTTSLSLRLGVSYFFRKHDSHAKAQRRKEELEERALKRT
jgi:hypothetical protein